jgi:hypothetical protein
MFGRARISIPSNVFCLTGCNDTDRQGSPAGRKNANPSWHRRRGDGGSTLTVTAIERPPAVLADEVSVDEGFFDSIRFEAYKLQSEVGSLQFTCGGSIARDDNARTRTTLACARQPPALLCSAVARCHA